jgi:Ser/Thr protein kinase RdoA (MazF antagonist)
VNRPTEPPSPARLAEIAASFAVDGAVGPIAPLGQGLINDTYRLHMGGRDFVLQRINTRVFPDPERIMANLEALAQRASQADAGIRVPAPIRSRAGGALVRDPDGGVWRLMELIPDGMTLGRIETHDQAMEVGRALGRFHRLAGSVQPGRLGVTLPGFHRTPHYLDRLDELRRRPPVDALAAPEAVADCLAFVDARRDLAQVLELARAGGTVTERVIHGDPKVDNILFHRDNGRALALIDLDTVQPGLIQHDLGDCLRSCCNRSGESPDGKAQARFDLGLCALILGAYGQETRGLLGPGDIAAIYDSIRLLPFELGVRFLIDHLEADRWFRVAHRGQNLHKARVQLALVADIERQEGEIRGIVAEAFGAGPA